MECLFIDDFLVSVPVEWLEKFLDNVFLIGGDLFLQFFWKYDIWGADCETVLKQPLIDDSLTGGHEFVGGVGADFEPCGMDKTTGAGTDDLFLESAW